MKPKKLTLSILLNSFSSKEIVKNIQVGESFTFKNEKIIFKKIAIEREKNYESIIGFFEILNEKNKIINLQPEIRIYNEPVTLFESIIVQPWQIIFLIIAVPGVILGLFMFALKDPMRKEVIVTDKDEKDSIRDVFSYVIKNIGAYIPLLIGSAFIIVLLYGVQSWVPTFLHRIHGWEHTRIGDQYGLVALFAGSLGVVSGPVIEKYLTVHART